MEMNDILSGLNSCDEDSCESMPESCSCTSNFGCPGTGGFGQSVTGCGFGSWIWILLILFYCGCGRNNSYGRGNDNCCCERKHECCGGRGNYGGGILGNCSSYLFLLVILFLCNNSNRNISCGTC